MAHGKKTLTKQDFREKRKKRDYKVVFSPSLSKVLGNRYVIMDRAEKEILDDAGGYGYKTRKGAVACFEWKRDVYDKQIDYKDEHLDSNEYEAKLYVQEFCRQNPTLIKNLRELMFYRKKKNRPMSDDEIIHFLNSQEIEFFPFTLPQLLRYWV